jgi:hypothetical protein
MLRRAEKQKEDSGSLEFYGLLSDRFQKINAMTIKTMNSIRWPR